jgi:hypothetical protein
MRFPRPRLTVRRLMIAVAVIALVTGVIAMLIQSERRRQRAVYHAKMETETQHLMNFYRGDLVLRRGENRDDFPAMLGRFTRRNLYHSEMRRKWEASAARPWLPVEPDPPEPK